MANSQSISEFTALTAPAGGDLIPVVDVSDTTDSTSGTTKKITATNLMGMVVVDATTYDGLATKYKAIIYGTGVAPTPTGYPDGCIYLQHAA